MNISGLPVYRPYFTPDYSPVVAKIKSIIDAQTAAILQPIDGLQQSSASYDLKISDYGLIQSDLAVLEETAQSLSGKNAFSRYRAQSSNVSIATSYATGDTLGGTYNVDVSQLAQGETLVSMPQQSPAIQNLGDPLATLTFHFSSGDTKNVTLDNNTLPGIAAAINQANIGITASVVSDANGFRLMLQGPSGAANAFSIGVNGSDAINHLLFYSDGAAGNAMSQTMAAQDAQARVNGATFSSNSNMLAGIAGGLTINLTGIGRTTVAVSPDLSRISYAVQAFVDAYNRAQSDIASYLGKELAGDKTLPAISSQLSADLAAQPSSPNGASNGLLAQTGITRNPDGTLSFDAQTFQNAYAQDPQGVAQLFSNHGNGLADQIAAQIHGVIQPSGDISTTIGQLLQKIRVNQQTADNIQNIASQNIENSAQYYVQLLARMIVKQIMDQFLQFTRQQSGPSATSSQPGSQQPNPQLPASLFMTPATLQVSNAASSRGI